MNAHVGSIEFADLVQADRVLRIETPLGADMMLPERFEIVEGIGGQPSAGLGGGSAGMSDGLFVGQIAVRSKKLDIAAADLIGKRVDVSVELGSEPAERRTWNALVSQVLVGPAVTRGLRSYRLQLRPAHWLMTRKRDCRIWLDKSAIEIATILCEEHGLPSPVVRGVIDPPPVQHYSVQFNESDWAYLCRRLEQDGLFWWTEQHRVDGWGMGAGNDGSVRGDHDLHIASDVSGYTPSPWGDEALRFAAGSSDRNQITRFDTALSFIPGARAGADWNFLTPGTVPGAGESVPSLVELPAGSLGSNADYEVYEYPSLGGYGTGEGADGASEGIDRDQLDRVERLRAQAYEADHARVEGEATVRTMAPGRRFTPYDVANPDNVFDEHVVTSIRHEIVDRSYETNEGDPEVSATFAALPATTPATPHRRTPRPRIDGQQIALVAGPEGEEIHPDQYGRIKLWFPWDRRAAKDGTDTCWVRVAQSWAGGGWGAQVIPRIGMEVLVTYLDGDPDRPLVTGVVPNPKQKVPYELPANKTKSVFRTNTHKSGSAGQFNEISFEDKTGGEDLFFHAQKDQTIKVLHNRSKRIENDQVESVGNNKSVEVESNHQEKIGGSMNLSVGGGSGSAIFGALGTLMGNSSAAMKNAAEESGDGFVSMFQTGLQATSVAAEMASLPANAGFNQAAGHKVDAGSNELAAGSALGSLLSKIMPISGIKNTIVEKAVTDTIGLARTEQIGMMKNTFVGKVQNTVVGAKQNTEVGEVKTTTVGRHYEINSGEDFIVTVGKSRLIMTKEGTIILRGVKIEFEGERQIRGKSRLIDWN